MKRNEVDRKERPRKEADCKGICREYRNIATTTVVRVPLAIDWVMRQKLGYRLIYLERTCTYGQGLNR